MPGNESESSAANRPLARRPWNGLGEVFAFLKAALLAVRDLWAAGPREPPATRGEDRDAL